MEARSWISGLEAVEAKRGIKAAYDLSATPYFLRRSGYSEGTLFPWVVSDFSLIDAVESGIVTVPRVPVADDSMTGTQPSYRDLWLRIREHLPRKGRGTEAVAGEPKLPKELQGALHSLYGNCEKYYRQWEGSLECSDSSPLSPAATRRGERQTADESAVEKAGASSRTPNGQSPPVFIAVCNNTNVSKLVFDYVAGWEKQLRNDKTALVPGALPIFSNVDGDRWTHRPNTVLIDSTQLECGEAMSEVYGVPFSFIPAAGSANDPNPGPPPKRVGALEDRIQCETAFPRLIGCRFDWSEVRLSVAFSDSSK